VGAAFRRHPVTAFFALTYAINVAACVASLAFDRAVSGVGVWPFWIVGIFSPTIGAVLTSVVIGGTDEVRRYVRRLRGGRLNARWVLVGMVLVLGPLALATVAAALGADVTGPEAGLTATSVIVALGYTLVAGPLSEEPGWRGFALPRLEVRHSALMASVMLGTVWAFWHVPFYFLPNQTMIPFPIFVPECIALSILFTAIYNNTAGSVVATILAHFWFNFAGAFLAGHFGILPPMLLYVGGSIMAVVLVVGVVVVEGPRTLSQRPDDQLPFQPARSVSSPA
jgi:hypothetical protein